MASKLLLAVILCACVPAGAEEMTVAAASDLNFVFQELAAQFQKQTGNALKLSFGSSGNLFSQIENGAPYDMFFSADIGYPKKLEAEGLIEPRTLYRYAVGRIVLWAPKDSLLDMSRGLTVLLDPAIRKIAIANPEHAPYGRAAVAAMQHEGIYDRVREKLVLGENISQAAQFVQSGTADAGILAMSLALVPTLKGQGKYVEIPSSLYSSIEQACVILKSSQKKQIAEQFLTFLKRPQTVSLMQQYGFVIPERALADQGKGKGHSSNR